MNEHPREILADPIDDPIASQRHRGRRRAINALTLVATAIAGSAGVVAEFLSEQTGAQPTPGTDGTGDD